MTLHSKDVVVGVQNILLDACPLQTLAQLLKHLLILMHLIDQLSVADGHLLNKYLVLVVQLTLPRENDLFVKLLFKVLDLSLDPLVDLAAQLLVESVSDEVGVSLALLDEVVRQLIDLRDDGLRDDLEDLLIGISDCICFKVLYFLFYDANCRF